MNIISNLINRAKNSTFAKDSFWAVFGNGLGNGLLLLAGIFIARLLGRDLYGEYGIVKTSMFYMAGFSTFGLVFTSTKYIAQYVKQNKSRIVDTIWTCTKITLCFSSFIGILIAIFANSLEDILDTDGIAGVLRTLSIIIIIRAIGCTGNGILAGLGKFDIIAKANIISGVVMLILCIPLTYYIGLYGALLSLCISQAIIAIYNYRFIYQYTLTLPTKDKTKEDIIQLIKFSFPIALQEISYSICNWAGIVILTRLSSVGEVGLYSASMQWNAVILMIPALLSNVVLSHLSSKEGKSQQRMVSKLILIFLICSSLPLIIIYFCVPLIVSFYGSQFIMMTAVMQITLLATIPECCSSVLKSELIAIGKPWSLFLLRTLRDFLIVIIAYLFLNNYKGESGAFYYGLSTLIATTVFFIGCYALYKFYLRKMTGHNRFYN